MSERQRNGPERESRPEGNGADQARTRAAMGKQRRRRPSGLSMVHRQVPAACLDKRGRLRSR